MSETAEVSRASAAAPLAWWIRWVVIVAAGLNVLGAVIAVVDPVALLPSGEHMTSAARLYAGYFVGRDLSLAVVLVAFLLLGARQVLAAALLMSALTQLFDVVVDGASGRAMLVPGLSVLCGLLFASAMGTSRAPLWRRSAWLDSGAGDGDAARNSSASRLVGAGR